MHRKIDAFRGDAALSSWIYRITFNTAMSRLRTSRFARPLEVQAPEPSRRELGSHAARSRATGRRLPTISVLRAQMRERLVDALQHLPAVYRVPVILRDIQGLSTAEASAVLQRQAADA